MDGPNVSPEVLQSPLEELKRKLSEADGSLIPVNKRLASGEQVALSVRRGQYPMQWEIDALRYEKNKPEPHDTYLVEAFGIDGDRIFPIGHWDWRISDGGEWAGGGGNFHKGSETFPTQPWHEEADKLWKGRHVAFGVVDEYQGQGVGSLLVAASAAVLDGKARNMRTGVLLEPARRTLSRFQLPGEKAEGMYYECPMGEFVNNPQVDQVLQGVL